MIVHENTLWLRLSSGGYDGMYPYSYYWSSEDGYNWIQERGENSYSFLGFARLLSFNQYLWLIEPYDEDPFNYTSNTVLKSYDGRNWHGVDNNLMCSTTGYKKDDCRHVVYQGKFWQGKEGIYIHQQMGLIGN